MAQRTIFVVDDEQDNLDYLSTIIEEAGYAAETFTDGSVALKQMCAVRPAMVFLDVQMPGMNGFQMLKTIRESQELAEMPVVFFSAMGAVTGEDYDPDKIEAQYGVRPDAFLTKPVQPDDVTGEMQRLLAT